MWNGEAEMQRFVIYRWASTQEQIGQDLTNGRDTIIINSFCSRQVFKEEERASQAKEGMKGNASS